MKETPKCAAVEPVLYDYLNGWLEASEAQLVFQHLGKCCRCRLELQRWRTFDQAVSDIGTVHAPEVPPTITQSIIQAVAREAELERAEEPLEDSSVRILPVLIGLAVLGSIAGIALARPLQSVSSWLEIATDRAAGALSTSLATQTPYWLLYPLWTLAGLLLCYALFLGCTDYVTKRYLRAG